MTGISKVMIEFYPYPGAVGYDSAWKTAQERLARLSYLLQKPRRPTTLLSLDSIGFIQSMDGMCFGLVSTLPESTSRSIEPITLHHLLSRNIPSARANTSGQGVGIPNLPNPPTLHQRYELAANLASSFYTFRLVRWYHKRFHSASVILCYPKNSTLQNAVPDYSHPYIGGFAASRPNSLTEISLPNFLNNDAQLYLHPDLTAPTTSGAVSFRAEHGVYSFGIMLAEIGFWHSVSALVKEKKGKNLPTTSEVRAKLIQKCESDLGCWVGAEYRDATLQCLRAGMIDAGGMGENLNDFFLDVVLVLAKCCGK